MAKDQGELRFSPLAQILIGVAFFIVGDIAWLFGSVSEFLAIVALIGVPVGVIVIVVGIVAAVRARTANQALIAAAAKATISNSATRAGVAAELRELETLHASGALSDNEFSAAKAKVLATG